MDKEIKSVLAEAENIIKAESDWKRQILETVKKALKFNRELQNKYNDRTISEETRLRLLRLTLK